MYSSQYYIKKAIEISKKSNDPITKVGCVLVLGDEKKLSLVALIIFLQKIVLLILIGK